MMGHLSASATGLGIVLLVVSSRAGRKEQDTRALYEARQAKCDYFVSIDGADSNDGTDLDSPFGTLKCACDPDCNNELQQGETICLLEGVHEIYDTIYVKGPNMREHPLAIMALGKDRSVSLDGMGQTNIFNALQTRVTFTGIIFANGKGTSGGAVYGERGLTFNNCVFDSNEATVHGGAVMGGHLMEFYNCDFLDNSAKFAGAIRINDIGSAIIKNCLFMGNKGEMRGGAIATQIEKEDEHSVKIEDTLFCFNESPMSPHIYNYRTAAHECTSCRFNSKHCCSEHGRVVPIDEAEHYVLPEGVTRERVCQCEEGWSGQRCETRENGTGGTSSQGVGEL